MDEVRAVAPRSRGYAVVLGGALVFVVGCLVPYVTLRASFAPSLYEMQTMRHSGLGWVGANLMLWTGLVALAVNSFAGIVRPQVWTAVALVAVAALWVLDQIGFAFGASGLWSTKEVGYWVVLVAVGLVIAGATMVGISVLRRDVPGRPDAIV